MDRLPRKSAITISIALMFVLTVAMGCAPNPSSSGVSADIISGGLGVGMEDTGAGSDTSAAAAYILMDNKNQAIQIHNYQDRFFYAFFTKDLGFETYDANMVLARLTQEGYSVGIPQFYPVDARYPSHMFVKVVSDEEEVVPQADMEAIILGLDNIMTSP